MAYNFKKYQQGDQVVQAQQQLDQQQALKPADYQSQWTDRISQKADEILNRKPFEYDVNADALYQQYADNYVRNGRMAMMDTVGNASTLTGGYGNSYANMAGQQVYQQYLAGLTDKIPELQQQALNRYNAEGDRMAQEYGLMADREAQDYGRYQDQYNQWLNWTNYLTGRLDNAQNLDYNMFANERDAEYKDWQQQQALAQQQVEYLLSIGAEVPEELAALTGYDQAYIDAKKKAASTPSYSGGGGGQIKTGKDITPQEVANEIINAVNTINPSAAKYDMKSVSTDDMYAKFKELGVPDSVIEESKKLLPGYYTFRKPR